MGIVKKIHIVYPPFNHGVPARLATPPMAI
jgi:hypothetical protein